MGKSDSDDLDDAFRTGAIFESSPEDMNRFLRVLGHINVNGESFQIRAVIRSLIINHLQTADVIRSLNTQNEISTKRVTVLTRWCAILAAVQVAGVVFFVWRDFNPRKVAVDKEPISTHSQGHTDRHESASKIEP